MENMHIISSNSHSEYDEPQDQLMHALEAKCDAPSSCEDRFLLDYLMNASFTWEEAVMLLHLREHLYENAEIRQRMTDDLRLHFARWLYANGEMNEG